MFSGTDASVRCLLVLFFMIWRVMKKFTKRLIANIVDRLAMIATPVVVNLFSVTQRTPIHPELQPSVQTPFSAAHDLPSLQCPQSNPQFGPYL